jgi:hypothetical protein
MQNAASGGIPAQSRSLLELIDRLRHEFPHVSAHAVVRCVSIVAHHPSSAALPIEVLLRRTERIARARLEHLTELPVPPTDYVPSFAPVPGPRTGDLPAASR